MTIGQHQQARIVGQQSQATTALFGVPADELIAVFEVKGGRTPGGHSQPLAPVNKGVAQGLADQADRVKIMVLHNEFVAPGDILRTGQQLEMATVQNALFVGGKVAAFSFAHGGSIKKRRTVVPKKMLTV